MFLIDFGEIFFFTENVSLGVPTYKLQISLTVSLLGIWYIGQDRCRSPVNRDLPVGLLIFLVDCGESLEK